ncbi:hypothetical protein JXJ21_02760 [candidate division KSB1 bacterium]|nr:hypothetical protein [candidate division KSB1 bacterium]
MLAAFQNSCRRLFFLCLCLIFLIRNGSSAFGRLGDTSPIRASNIQLIVGDNATETELRIAGILRQRILWFSRVSIDISTARTTGNSDFLIYLGRAGHHRILDSLCATHNITLPGRTRSAPEGFAVKSLRLDNIPTWIAVGTDHRGALYAIGELLRHITFEPDCILCDSFEVRTAPAYRYRGFEARQGEAMQKITHARLWGDEDKFRLNIDYALAGANCFYTEWEPGPVYHFIKSFDLMTTDYGVRPNYLGRPFPDAWKAKNLPPKEGTGWICPGIPEAREAALEYWTDIFRKKAQHDILRFYAGDPGGCRGECCKPWGKTFMHLCREFAERLSETHPNTQVFIANQHTDNAGDQAIFDYLNQTPRSWLKGLAYGPGSNAMSTFHRDELREDLFEFPGNGTVNRYLAETLKQLPCDMQLMHYSDITHWFRSQYAVEYPEPHLIKAYGRRTFHARPRALYRIFQSIMPFSEGDIIYCEGYHDEFNQYLWCRLLWDPCRELEDIMHEYCQLHFGKAAADLMCKALFQLEKNLEAPLADNDGIETYYVLVSQAGRRIPKHLIEKNYRWQLHQQKAALDRYNQLKLQREVFKEQRVREALKFALESKKYLAAIENALTIISEPAETPQMAKLREEARLLGEETDRLFGVRNVGYFRLDVPFRDLPGLLEMLKQARSSKSNSRRKECIISAIQITNKPTEVGSISWSYVQ